MRLGRRTKAALIAFVFMAGMVTATVAVLHAEEGPYNSNPPFCREHTAANPLWWYYECMYPDDPSWGKVY